MKKVVVHSGSFHVDELFAVTLLARFYFHCPVSDLILERTRSKYCLKNYINDPNVFVVDVGTEYNAKMLNFDHHQNDPSLVWDNHIPTDEYPLLPLSSCGLIWNWLKKEHKEALKVHSKYVLNSIESMCKEIDMNDNNIKGWNEIKTYNRFNRKMTDDKGFAISIDEYEEIQMAQFKKALQVAEWHLDNIIEMKSREAVNDFKVRASIRHSIKQGHPEILILKNDLFNAKRLGSEYSEVAKLIAVYHEEKGQWSLKIVNDSWKNAMIGRLKMPKSWGGLSGEEFKQVSGFDYVEFCHKDRFIMALSGTKEQCLAVCKEIIKQDWEEKHGKVEKVGWSKAKKARARRKKKKNKKD